VVLPVNLQATCTLPDKWIFAGKQPRQGWKVRLENVGKKPVFAKRTTVRTGERIEAEILMENQGGEAVRIEEDWDRYVWVAFAKDDGRELVASTAYDGGIPAQGQRARKRRSDQDHPTVIPHSASRDSSASCSRRRPAM